MKQYRMKEWFFQKVAKEVGAPRVWNNTLFAVFGETEKAYHAIVGSVTFKKTLWIPKSCVEIDEEETSYGTMFV